MIWFDLDRKDVRLCFSDFEDEDGVICACVMLTTRLMVKDELEILSIDTVLLLTPPPQPLLPKLEGAVDSVSLMEGE
jgi:hypothetical protein